MRRAEDHPLFDLRLQALLRSWVLCVDRTDQAESHFSRLYYPLCRVALASCCLRTCRQLWEEGVTAGDLVTEKCEAEDAGSTDDQKSARK